LSNRLSSSYGLTSSQSSLPFFPIAFSHRNEDGTYTPIQLETLPREGLLQVQGRAVKLLVQSLKSDYHIPSANVVGHKDIRASATECPGKFFNMADVADFRVAAVRVAGRWHAAGTSPSRTKATTCSRFMEASWHQSMLQQE
jgi:N-acetyl-anhydromuramyl-L-alanine amidase AmpD